MFRTLKHVLTTEACRVQSEDAYYGHLVLRLMASGDIATYRRLKLDGPIIDAIEGVLTAQLEHHLDRRLKSLQFLHQMRTR